MIVTPHAQGTTGWIECRAGILSASELGELVKLNFELRSGEGVHTLLARKIAEKWSGPIISDGGFGGTFAMQQGQILEEQALPWLEFTQNLTIERPGFLMTDDKKFGASPDGIIGGITGLEVKCYQATNTVRTLLDGAVPREHMAQIHAGMFVTGFQQWMFLAYHRSFPKLILTVKRDEEIQEKIAKAVNYFAGIFDDAWSQLVDLNGGIIPTREPMVFAHE